MPNYLLTGAGFSRNWGGWLSAEVFEYFLGCDELDHDARMMLWRDKNDRRGFEDTLAQIQSRARLGDQRMITTLRAFQSATTRMFDSMNDALAEATFESSNELASSIAGFLTKFDVIFTLNQDWLMEQHYLNGNVSLLSNGKWDGFQMPGVAGGLPDSITRKRPEVIVPQRRAPEFDRDRLQPYVKLHGSSHWRNEAGGDLLIMGGGKEETIAGSPLLSSYYDAFCERLKRPAARLMTIGYGYNDTHINSAILNGVVSGQLKLFIVDPLGTDVLDKRDPRAQIQERPDLRDTLMRSIIGASRRPLSSTFGADRVELGKLMSFFH